MRVVVSFFLIILVIKSVLCQSIDTSSIDTSTSKLSDTLAIRDSLRSQDTLSTVEKISHEVDEASKKLLGLPGKIEVSPPPSISDLISVSTIFWSVVWLFIGYLFIKYTSKVLEYFAERSIKYRITFKSFIPVVKILGWIAVISLVIIGVIRPPAATVLAFSASIGVAVGFASQDILKNIFGGIMILFDRPFKSGDKIEIGGHYGEVVEIGLRSTRVVTPDDNLVSIPNSEIMNSSVSNANAGEPNCQVVAEVFLPIDTNISEARSVAEESALVSKYVFLNKPVTIVFSNEFKEREPVLKMKIKAYVLDIRDEFKFKSEMMELTVTRLVASGILKRSA